MGTLLLCALLLGATLPPSATGATVVLTRFASGDTELELGFSDSLTNGSLGITLPRSSLIVSASMTVQGILSPAGEYVTRDFATTAIGSNLWALHEEATGIYPPTVDAYASGWEPIPASQVANVSSADGEHWNTTTPTDPTEAPWEYPVQLYHFKIPAPVSQAISYQFNWLGHGTCLGNASVPHWAEYYMYDFQDLAWDHMGGYSDGVAGRDDDQWFNTTFAGPVPTISANGSVEVAVVGPHADVDDANSTSDRGHLLTDYIALTAKVAEGEAKYPTDVVLGVGATDITLSTGDLEGVCVVDDNLGLGQALQTLLNSKPAGQGNVTLELEFRVGALTAATVRVADLNVSYEAQDPSGNNAPVWRGPSSVYATEDAGWESVLDLDAVFWDDHDQGALAFAVVSVSDPAALSGRVVRGILDNWTLEVLAAPDFNGEVTVNLSATDRLGKTTESPGLTVEVSPVPDAPVLVDPPTQSVGERERLALRLIAADVDLPGDTLTFSDTSTLFDVDPATGDIDWTPSSEDVGTHTCMVTVTDTYGLSDSAQLVVQVANANDAPVLTVPSHVDAVQDVPFTLTLTASDPDLAHGDVILFSASSADLVFEMEPSTGLLWFTPRNADVGMHLLAVRVQDAALARDERTVEVHVSNVNDAPTIVPLGTLTFNQGTPVSVRIMAQDPDLGLPLEAPEALALDTDAPAWLAPDLHGWVNFTSDQSRVGDWTVTYTVTDLGGLTDSITVVWRIVDLNDAPVIATDVEGLYTVQEDGTFHLGVGATDLDGDALAWSDDTPLFDIDGATGELAFTARQADVGTHAVTVTVSDGRGGAASVSFELVVVNVNDAPVILTVLPANGTVLHQGDALTLSATASDEDGDALGFSWSEGGTGLGAGTPLVLGSLGAGRHTITVSVTDGRATVERTVEVTVEAGEGGEDGGGEGGALLLVLALLAIPVVVVLVVVLALRARLAASKEPQPPAEKDAGAIEVEHRGT
jgi:hypothetical protein